MDPSIHLGHMPIRDSYHRFGVHEAVGISEQYALWAVEVSTDTEVIALLETLPPHKRQPNLVFAAARWVGAGASYASFRDTVCDHWPLVRETILTHSTQTNEAGRCAVLLPWLASLPQPLALIEVGAAAGLCLLPDEYSYRYTDGPSLDPDDGPSEVLIPCRLGPGLPIPTMPRIAWRAGIDLSPVDIHDGDACAWLETLVWPEQEDRRVRLRAALARARRNPPSVVRGDLNDLVASLAAEAPSDATLVVFHTAVLAYLEAEARTRFVSTVTDLPGHWISNEGQGVVDLSQSFIPTRADDGRFVLAVDGVPTALTDPHGWSVVGLDA